jgi:hypothetical protein
VSSQKKILQGLAIPHTALISVIFCLMVLSFPTGAYLVFNSEIGDDITHEYPMDSLSLFLAGIGFEVPIKFELGDGFVVIWCTFLILFTVAILGPQKKFFTVLQSMMSEGRYKIQDSYIVAVIKWFSILVVVSGSIIGVQEFVGISIEQPEAPNQLIQFFDISLAPIIEELGFRVVLIGLPLFMLYSHKLSFKFFVKSLWWPWKNLRNVNMKKALSVIVIAGILFGAAHIFSDEAWSTGKLAQAIASGIIIGWVYFRYGFVSAVLIHWATNYFIFSYGYIVADINQISIGDAFSHSLLSTLELMLIVTGIISIAVLMLNYVYSKKHTLEA